MYYSPGTAMPPPIPEFLNHFPRSLSIWGDVGWGCEGREAASQLKVRSSLLTFSSLVSGCSAHYRLACTPQTSQDNSDLGDSILLPSKCSHSIIVSLSQGMLANHKRSGEGIAWWQAASAPAKLDSCYQTWSRLINFSKLRFPYV